jgi:hypothetical protein
MRPGDWDADSDDESDDEWLDVMGQGVRQRGLAYLSFVLLMDGWTDL